MRIGRALTDADYSRYVGLWEGIAHILAGSGLIVANPDITTNGATSRLAVIRPALCGDNKPQANQSLPLPSLDTAGSLLQVSDIHSPSTIFDSLHVGDRVSASA
jgi:hypothetical protein